MLRIALRSTISLAVLAFSLAAQTNFGRISGTVSDSSGAVIPGVKVIIIDQDTQAARPVTTDDHGFYVAENLPIGPYSVSLDHPGFKRAEQRGLNLVADGHLTANFTLQVGDSAQSVEVVEAAGEVLNTVSGEVAHVVDQEQVENVPLNGRAYTELLTLVPGAVVTNPDQFGTLTSLSATNQSINGHRTNQNNLTVDGVGNLDAGSNGSLINNVSPDFLQEVKIQTSNFSSEYGRSAGAAFNIMTRNGTNALHGGAFEYFRNDALDARNFFSPYNTELRYNDFGYKLGGPIKKNKIFFFIGEDWKRLRQQTAGTRVNLPTTAQLAGDFNGSGKTVNQPGTKTPFPDNIIPFSMITADGRAITNVYKTVIPMTAVFTNLPTSNNAIFQNPNPLDYRQDLARIDYRINDRHTLYGRWIDDYNSIYIATGPGGSLPITPEIRDRPGKSALLSETWVAAPTVINEAHLGASWNSQHYWNRGDTWKRSTQGFAFQRIYNTFGPYVDGIPNVSISGGITGWTGPANTLISPTAEIEANDTVSIVRGQHTVRLGVMIMRNRKDQNGRSPYDGSISFNNSGNPNTTGYPFADALLGNYYTYTEAAYDPMGHYRYTEPAVFVHDSWKASRKLSLDLGLRYEYMMAMYSTVDNLSEFVPSLYDPAKAVRLDANGNIIPGSGNIYNGLVRVANGVNPGQAYLVPNANDPAVLSVPAGAPRGMYPSRNTFSPRLGFAYALNEKTVLRGGFGLYYDRLQGNPTFYTLNNPPYVGSAQYQFGNLSSIRNSATVTPPWGTIQTIDSHLKIPYSEQFSLGIQRELPYKLFAQATYVGTLGRHLLDEPDINQPAWAVLASVPSNTSTNSIRPYAGYSTIQQFESRATSNYNALQLYLARRAGRVMFTASYTFSKNLGDASSDTGNYRNAFNARAYYGPLTYDMRHALNGTFVWNMAALRNQSRLLRGPFGAWQLSAIVHVQSGFYYSITGNSKIVSGRLADYLGGAGLLPNPGPNGWFNPAAFTAAPQDRWGTSGVGNVEGPGLQQYNLSLTKFFSITERVKLRARADFINAFNCVNFQGPSTDSSSNDFGTISSAYPPRVIQLGLRLDF
jgi:hypothetical protein